MRLGLGAFAELRKAITDLVMVRLSVCLDLRMGQLGSELMGFFIKL